MGVTPFTGELKDDILRKRRDYFKDKVKAPLIKALSILAHRYPGATPENIKKHNSKVLLKIWDKFFQYEDNQSSNPHRAYLFRAIQRVVMAEYEHDEYYAQRMDWFLEELVKAYNSGEWWKQADHFPAGCWKEPEVVEAWEKLRKEMLADLGEEVLSQMKPITTANGGQEC